LPQMGGDFRRETGGRSLGGSWRDGQTLMPACCGESTGRLEAVAPAKTVAVGHAVTVGVGLILARRALAVAIAGSHALCIPAVVADPFPTGIDNLLHATEEDDARRGGSTDLNGHGIIMQTVRRCCRT